MTTSKQASFPQPRPSRLRSHVPVSPCPFPDSLQMDLHRVRTTLVEAELSSHPGDRFLTAHLAALRTAALVLALRARPAAVRKAQEGKVQGHRRARPRNAWSLLSEVAPELGEWAAFFAATEGKRDALRAGAGAIVNAREADDLVRDAQTFFTVVERALHRSSASGHQPAQQATPGDE